MSEQIDPMLERARELNNLGLEWSQAWGKAWLEHRIREWPEKWGDDLEILLYGDFEAPESEMHIEPLGITIYPEKLVLQRNVDHG